jgi:hypothetical protein
MISGMDNAEILHAYYNYIPIKHHIFHDEILLSSKKSVVSLVTEYGVESHNKCDEPSKDVKRGYFTQLLPNLMK